VPAIDRSARAEREMNSSGDSNVRPRPLALVALLLVAVAIVLAVRASSTRDAADAARTTLPAVAALRDPHFRIAGVHFWQGNWNYNFWSNLRLGSLTDDLRRIRALGFNTIVLTVPWGVFQTDADPPRYDDDAYRRLTLVLDAAWREGLYTILRVGTLERVPRGVIGESFSAPYVFFDERERRAYADLFRETSARLADKPGLLFQFFSWEDITAYLHVGQQAEAERLAYASRAPGWTKHLARRSIAEWNQDWGTSYASIEAVGVPPYRSLAFREFLRFADKHLLMVVLPQIAAAARQGDPHARLSYEIRVDGEPIESGGQTEFIGHEETWPLTRDYEVVTAYFNPYWGARNESDVISPEDALRNLGHMVRRLRRAVGGKRVFFDQFNFVDSTPAFRHNSRLAGEPQIATFLAQALNLLGEQTLGYALWSLDAYEANVLRSSRFEHGLDDWHVVGASGGAAGVEVRVDAATNDHFATIAPGGTLAQDVRASWNPGGATPDVPYTLRLRARAAGGTLDVRWEGAGGQVPAAAHVVTPGAAWQLFEWQVPFAPAGRLTLAARDGVVDVDDVTLFNHVQEAALFDPRERPLGTRPEVVAAANRARFGGGVRASDDGQRSDADGQQQPSIPTGAADDGWLLGRARLPLSIPPSATTIELELYLPDQEAWRAGNGFTASIGGTSLGSFDVSAGGALIVLPLPAGDAIAGEQILQLDFRRTVVPAEHDPGASDERPLAAVLRAVRVK
jgi:hypothetical protein